MKMVSGLFLYDVFSCCMEKDNYGHWLLFQLHKCWGCHHLGMIITWTIKGRRHEDWWNILMKHRPRIVHIKSTMVISWMHMYNVYSIYIFTYIHTYIYISYIYIYKYIHIYQKKGRKVLFKSNWAYYIFQFFHCPRMYWNRQKARFDP